MCSIIELVCPFPVTILNRLKGGNVSRGMREGGNKGVSKWVLVCLLRGADIIKDSPCVLPLLSSKGMLAPGSSASYCVALAEKRLCKWLWTAEEEGARALAVFPIYQQGGGKQTVQLAFPHICMQTFLLHCLILSFLLCLTLSLAVYVSVTHSVTPFFSFPLFFPRPLPSLFTSSKPPPLFFRFHFFLCRLCASCAVSSSPN